MTGTILRCYIYSDEGETGFLDDLTLSRKTCQKTLLLLMYVN